MYFQCSKSHYVSSCLKGQIIGHSSFQESTEQGHFYWYTVLVQNPKSKKTLDMSTIQDRVLPKMPLILIQIFCREGTVPDSGASRSSYGDGFHPVVSPGGGEYPLLFPPEIICVCTVSVAASAAMQPPSCNIHAHIWALLIQRLHLLGRKVLFSRVSFESRRGEAVDGKFRKKCLIVLDLFFASRVHPQDRSVKLIFLKEFVVKICHYSRSDAVFCSVIEKYISLSYLKSIKKMCKD